MDVIVLVASIIAAVAAAVGTGIAIAEWRRRTKSRATESIYRALSQMREEAGAIGSPMLGTDGERALKRFRDAAAHLSEQQSRVGDRELKGRCAEVLQATPVQMVLHEPIVARTHGGLLQGDGPQLLSDAIPAMQSAIDRCQQLRMGVD
ncbi:hypothetical protein [Kineococcus terrestris]|uniref:hypothetical protein n=1 Tax=Kineococcus terrestris TaxID=2044856 RepID=UPI0034DB60B5